MSTECLDPMGEGLLRDEVELILNNHVNNVGIIQNYDNLNDPAALVLGGTYFDTSQNINFLVQLWVVDYPIEKSGLHIKVGIFTYEITTATAINLKHENLITSEEFRDIKFWLEATEWDAKYSQELASLVCFDS